MGKALCWKAGRKAVSRKLIKGVKLIYRNVKITAKFEAKRLLEECDSGTGLLTT
jgi:hypothetical protein